MPDANCIDCDELNERDFNIQHGPAIPVHLDRCSLEALGTAGPPPTQEGLEPCTVETITPIEVGDCTPETADLDLIASVDAEIVDQLAADNLCAPFNSPWDVVAENAAAPFPVDEDFRNDVLGQPITLFGDAELTGNGVIDPIGDGWLRLTEANNLEFGGAILDTPYSSLNDITFQFTYASYGGSGADGFSVFLLDGDDPMPASLGGRGGALGYSWNAPEGDDGIASGYLGIGLDEFGNYVVANVTGNGGTGAAVPNSIGIRGSGNLGAPLSATYDYITHEVLPNGETIDNHDRNNPVVIRGSIITEGAQLLLSVQADFGAGFITVIERENIQASVGPVPDNLRIGFAGSTGAATNIHEIRDLTISTSARQHWRGFSLATTGEVDQCVLDGNGTVEIVSSVDVTVNSDTQANANGDGDNEFFIKIVDIVTNEVLSESGLPSSPNVVGQTRTLTTTANINPANNDLANIRVYIGAESYDLAGSYDSTLFNFVTEINSVCTITFDAMPISTPCPIQVEGALSTPTTTIVCGLVDGITITLIRRETVDDDGEVVVEFLGPNGNVVVPTQWGAGDCFQGLEVVTGYLQRCDPFDISLPVRQEGTFSDTGLGTTTLVTDFGTANLITNALIEAQDFQNQQELNGLLVTPFDITTDSGDVYRFPPSAFIGLVGGTTLQFTTADLLQWPTAQTDEILLIDYSIFSNCECLAVELVERIHTDGRGDLLGILDPETTDINGGKGIITFPLPFGDTGPFVGPCPVPVQVLGINDLCCDDDLLTNNPDIANQRLMWAAGSELSDLFNNGAIIPGNDGDDVDEIRDRLAPGVSPSILTEPGRDDPVYRPESANGLSVVQFDGVDDRMALDVGARPINQSFTMFYLISTQDVINGTACALAVGPTGGGQYAGTPNTWQISRQGFENVLVFRMVGAGTTGVGNQVAGFTPVTENVVCPLCQGGQLGIDIGLATWDEFSDGLLHLLTVSYDGSRITGYFDGDLRFEADVLNDGSFPLTEYFRISGNRINDSFLAMDLAELFISDGILTPEQVSAINAYLICKWAIDPSLAVGGAGNLELAPKGTYSNPTPFKQIVRADGTIAYLNSVNGLEFPVPPTPGLSICGEIGEGCCEVSIDTRFYSAIDGGDWTPALIPAGRVLTSIAMSVVGIGDLVTFNEVHDSDGAITSNLPLGFSTSWNTQSDASLLVPPNRIGAGSGANARILITYTTRSA